MSSKQVILVTGASGFLGSHIVSQLLDAGYIVRASARGAKAETLRKDFAGNDNVQVVEIKDILNDDLSASLKGVHGVIHTAVPLAGKATPADALATAINGTLNVLRQAVTAGVKKVVLTSSYVALVNPDRSQGWNSVLNQKSWGSVTAEQVTDGTRDPFFVYSATKVLAEKAAWDFAEEHRADLDLATINPPFIYGPFDKNQTVMSKDSVGTQGMVYELIDGADGRALPAQLPPHFIDVRDVAKAHILALQAPPATDLTTKRFLITSGPLLWKDAVEYLRKERPGLVGRLPSTQNVPPLPGKINVVDVSAARDVLGLKEYIGWEQSLLDTVDSLLAAEKIWTHN